MLKIGPVVLRNKQKCNFKDPPPQKNKTLFVNATAQIAFIECFFIFILVCFSIFPFLGGGGRCFFWLETKMNITYSKTKTKQ